MSIVRRSLGVRTCSTFDMALSSVPSEVIIPCIDRDAIHTGTIVETRLGSNSDSTSGTEVTLPLTQSIIVVTSPMGDHAPPLLAAMMMILANSQRSFCSGIIRRISMTITMAVVMLSNTADIKKVRIEISHNNVTFLRVVMRLVMIENPPWTSISSTIVIAPIRKKRVSEISPRCSTICTPEIKRTHCSTSGSAAIVGLSDKNSPNACPSSCGTLNGAVTI